MPKTTMIISKEIDRIDYDLTTAIARIIDETMLHGDNLIDLHLTRGYFIDRVSGNANHSAHIVATVQDEYGDTRKEHITLHDSNDYHCDFMLGSEV